MTTTKLEDKEALVTGGTTGIGLGNAKTLAEAGATGFSTGRRQAELDAAVALIGERAIGVRSDVSKLADPDARYGTIRTQV